MQYPTFQKKLNKRDGEENRACISIPPIISQPLEKSHNITETLVKTNPNQLNNLPKTPENPNTHKQSKNKINPSQIKFQKGNNTTENTEQPFNPHKQTHRDRKK